MSTFTRSSAFCILPVLVSPAVAQTGGGYELARVTIAGGGGTSAAGAFRLHSTFGQSGAGEAMSGGGWSLTAGFWAAGGAGTCYANCDGSLLTPVLNVDDFTCFINRFAEAAALPPAQQITHYANCDSSTLVPVLNVDDFTCFINAFAQGCP